MAFLALATFSTWSASSSTSEKLLVTLLDEVCLHLQQSSATSAAADKASGAVAPNGDDDDECDTKEEDLVLCDQEAVDLILCLVVQEDALLVRRAPIAMRVASLLNCIVEQLDEEQLDMLDHYFATAVIKTGRSDDDNDDGGGWRVVVQMLSSALVGKIVGLGKKMWHEMVRDVMMRSQPAPRDWASLLVTSSGVIVAAADRRDPSIQVASDAPATLRYVLGLSTPFQTIVSSLLQIITRLHVLHLRDELVDSAIQLLVDIVAEEEALQKSLQASISSSRLAAGGIVAAGEGGEEEASCDGAYDASAMSRMTLTASRERQQRAESMLLAIEAVEDSSEGDIIRAALGVQRHELESCRGTASTEKNCDQEVDDFVIDPLSLPISGVCVRALRCATAQLRFACHLLFTAEECGREQHVASGLCSPLRTKLEKLLDWFGKCHPSDKQLFVSRTTRLSLSSVTAAQSKSAGGAAASIYSSTEFVLCLINLCEGLTNSVALTSPPPTSAQTPSSVPSNQVVKRPALSIRFRPPQKFVQLASLLPAQQLVSQHQKGCESSGLALLCSAYFLMLCLNNHLALHAAWFVRTIPKIYLRHPTVVAAATGFMERKVEADFAAKEISVLTSASESERMHGDQRSEADEPFFWTASCAYPGGGGE